MPGECCVIPFIRYVRSLVRARRANPENDLISALALAEQAGDQLSEDELLAMIVLLLVAGHETTVNLIGNGVLALLENPDQLDSLHNDPALIKSGVEELLRHSGPLETATQRYPREDTSVAGVTIPRGELVFAVLASANRDEQQFENADRLDLGREPNPHVAFGYRMHYCLGASLARLEAQIAIATLFRRVSELEVCHTIEQSPLEARSCTSGAGELACAIKWLVLLAVFRFISPMGPAKDVPWPSELCVRCSRAAVLDFPSTRGLGKQFAPAPHSPERHGRANTPRMPDRFWNVRRRISDRF